VTTIEEKVTLDKERAKGEDRTSALAPTPSKEGMRGEGGGSTGRWEKGAGVKRKQQGGSEGNRGFQPCKNRKN
jgi:hypothetical protein